MFNAPVELRIQIYFLITDCLLCGGNIFPNTHKPDTKKKRKKKKEQRDKEDCSGICLSQKSLVAAETCPFNCHHAASTFLY